MDIKIDITNYKFQILSAVAPICRMDDVRTSKILHKNDERLIDL